MKKFIVSFLFLLISVCYVTSQEESGSGNKAPDFVLNDLAGDNFRLYENLGKGPIVINFWATWCVPCIEELKQMKKIYQKYEKHNVTFLAISVDDPKTVGRVKSFVNSRNYPYHILLDTNSEVMHLYQSKVPPYTVLIDSSGYITYSHVGYRMGDEKILDKKLQKLLSE